MKCCLAEKEKQERGSEMLLIKVSLSVVLCIPKSVRLHVSYVCEQQGRFSESGFQPSLTSPSKPVVNVFLIAAAELNTG